MRVELIVHVNTLPGGRVIAAPVHLPAYAASGGSEEGLLADIARRVGEASFSVGARRPLLLPTRASLEMVIAEVGIDKETDEHLRLRLSAVVLTSPDDPDAAVVAVAPSVEAPVAGRSPEEALGRLAARCSKVLSKWAADDALAAQLTGEVALAGLDDGHGVVVRIYEEARGRVRDPRTGAQVRKITRVLSGAIDDFVVAAIAGRAPAPVTPA